MTRITQLSLQSTMVHEMPRGRYREGTESQIVYSTTPTVLNDRTDRFVREEMLIPSLELGREIIYMDSDRSEVPKLVREALSNNLLLASHSRLIADHMHATQMAGSSAGVFMSSIAQANSAPRFVILKAEHQEGVRLRHTGEGDDIVFEVEHLTEIIMGQNSKVYKIAMLWVDPVTDKLVGLMVDKQNGAAFADYFLHEFLGMELTHRSEVLTKDFVHSLTRFINSPYLSADKRARYATAVVALLESPADQIKPNQFIVDFIDPDDRDGLAATLPAQTLSMSFQKDTTLVKSQIGGLKLKMSSGRVSINATAEAMEDGTVSIDNENPLEPRVIVKGSPDSIALSTAPR